MAALHPTIIAEPAPQAASFPVGLFQFTVADLNPGDAATVTIFSHSGLPLNGYFKYGPTPFIPTAHWYEYGLDGLTGAEFFADQIDVHLVDGDRGDDDLTVNGSITDIGAPAVVVAEVVGRHIFYNNSHFDLHDPGANVSDDMAIATDKQALLPGEAAAFLNYTSYNRGINGIFIDISHLAENPTLQNFDLFFRFRVGNSTNVSTWLPPSEDPIAIDVRPDDGFHGSDRVTIIWADGVIGKEWLQVTVLGNQHTGLPVGDVHYWGNAIGEVGNSSTDTFVNATDIIAARDNPHGIVDQAAVTDVHDFNRDRFVNATDLIIARDNVTGLLNSLRLITAPIPASTVSLFVDRTTGDINVLATNAELESFQIDSASGSLRVVDSVPDLLEFVLGTDVVFYAEATFNPAPLDGEFVLPGLYDPTVDGMDLTFGYFLPNGPTAGVVQYSLSSNLLESKAALAEPILDESKQAIEEASHASGSTTGGQAAITEPISSVRIMRTSHASERSRLAKYAGVADAATLVKTNGRPAFDLSHDRTGNIHAILEDDMVRFVARRGNRTFADWGLADDLWDDLA